MTTVWLAVSSVVRLASASPAWAQATDAGWSYQLTPFVWASGLGGEVGVRNRTVDVGLSFTDILENLDGALMLAGGAWRGPAAVGLEIIYMQLSNQGATPGPLFESAELGAKQLTVELTGRYRLLREPVMAELLAGGRYWRLKSSLDLTAGAAPPVSVSDTKEWLDPLVGVNTVVELGSRWSVQGRGDASGFGVGSDLTWQLLGVFRYLISDSWSVGIGYRYLDVDYDEDGFTYDVTSDGVVLGAEFHP
jgi:hypothetical protein